MLVKIILSVISLDFGFLLNLIVDNIFFAFAFVCAAFFFSSRNFFGRLFSILVVVFGIADLQRVHGLVLFSSAGLFLLMIGRMSLLTISENIPKYKKYSPFLFAAVTYGVLFFINFFW